MEQLRIHVFKEITQDNQTLYQWFRLGEEGEEHIVPEELLSQLEHEERLAVD